MFLSQLVIPAADRRTMWVTGNPHRLHAALLTAFPPDVPGGDRRMLYRVEPEIRNDMHVVLVQSHTRPDWTRIGSNRFKIQRHDAKGIDPRFRQGQILRFRLRANPTLKRAGNRVPLTGDLPLEQWLIRKFENAGCRLTAATVVDEGKVVAWKKTRNQSETAIQLTFRSVRYEGHLEVVKPDGLRAAMEAGIGPAKAFGFGLLSLAKA